MDFQEDGDVHIRIGKQKETLLNTVTVLGNDLKGSFTGFIPNEEGFNHPHTIRLHVRLKEGRIFGSAISTFYLPEKGSFSLPYYIHLELIISDEGDKSVSIHLNPKIYAVQTNVTDLNRAVEFYQELGFELSTRDYFPRVAPMMNGKTMLVLHHVEKATPTGPSDARTTLNMAVRHLDSIVNEFKNNGIEIIHEEPQEAAIGKWKAIRDRSGNIINLIEPNRDIGDLEKPRVNNVSIVVTDMDRAVDFYCNKLGFDIFSVTYYPPVIPLRTKGVISNIALHESAEKNGQRDYPNGTQTFLVIQVDDLVASMDVLKTKGVEFLHDTPQQAAVGIYAAFRDPFGLVHELLEIR